MIRRASETRDVTAADGWGGRVDDPGQVVELKFAFNQLLFGAGLAGVLVFFVTATSLLENNEMLGFFCSAAGAVVQLFLVALMVWVGRKVYVRVSDGRVEIRNQNLLIRTKKRRVEFGLDEVESVEENDKAIAVKLKNGGQVKVMPQVLGKKDRMRLMSILKSAAGSRMGL